MIPAMDPRYDPQLWSLAAEPAVNRCKWRFGVLTPLPDGGRGEKGAECEVVGREGGGYFFF